MYQGKCSSRVISQPNSLLRRALFASLSVAVLALSAPIAKSEDAVTVAHGISKFGDLKYGPDFEHLDYVNPEAPKGGEISMSFLGTFDSFNPYSRKGRAGILASSAFESLLDGTADEAGANYYGLIAETLEYPDSKDWVIFNIRPEAQFSNGNDITADDVKFSYELFLEQSLASYAAALTRSIEAVEILGPKRIKFTFTPEAPRSEVLGLAGGMTIMSKDWYEETGARLDESRLDPGIGSGPYVLDSYEINQQIIYRRNPDYWAADLPLMRGRANFDTIRIEYFVDSTAAFEGFKAGEYTYRVENTSKIWANEYTFDAMTSGAAIQEEIGHGSPTTGQSFVFNLRRERFQDMRVREAIGLMFNFEWSNEALFYGLYSRINSFWDNTYLAASGTPSDAELALLEPIADILPDGVLTEPAVVAPTSGARQLDRANLRKASALLDAAGWIVGDDGMRRNAVGDTLVVEILEDSPTFDRVINPYVDSLRRLGVDASLSRVDPAQYTSRQRAFDYDMIIEQFSLGFEPGGNLKQYFGSEDAETSVFNGAGLQSPAVDALIEIVRTAETADELKVGVTALDRVLRAERFWVPQWYKPSNWVAYYDMYEHPENMPPYALGTLDFWWYNADKAEALKASGALR